MQQPETFDYIVVGAGSAGCALANRLTENGNYTVCLLEAGPVDRNPLIRMPAGLIALVRGWFCNWSFWSEPQQHLANRRLYQPRGKVLGGSSAINGMVNIRGHRKDYDHWAALGNPGWSYDEVLPLFRQCETYEPFADTPDADKYHGTSGPLNVAARRSNNPISEAFVEAAKQAGHAANADFNGAHQEGVGLYHVYQKDGQRCSNARAYLQPAKARHNLTIVTGAQVTKVLIENQQATGVSYLRDGKQHQVTASREVILSAGALQSPQLLMLSGIGDQDELSACDIAVKQALPGVGKNLQDHLDVIIETRTKSHRPFSLHPSSWGRLLLQGLGYLFSKRGELTSNVVESGGFFKTTPEEAIPNIQWHVAFTMNAKHGLDLTNVFKSYGFSVMAYDLRPLSRGRVGLHSADPLAPPLIDPNLGSNQRDINNLVAAIKETRRVLSQEALASFGLEEFAPGAAVQSDEQLEKWVRDTGEIAYHPVGTCKMGPDTDPQAVVDARLRVRGLKGLRVVDCSIMPTLVGGNTNQPATMIGEKGAAMILEDAE